MGFQKHEKIECIKNKQIHIKKALCDIPKMSYLSGSISSMVRSLHTHRKNYPGNKSLII